MAKQPPAEVAKIRKAITDFFATTERQRWGLGAAFERLPQQPRRPPLGGQRRGDRIPQLGRELRRGVLRLDEKGSRLTDRPLGALDAVAGGSHAVHTSPLMTDLRQFSACVTGSRWPVRLPQPHRQ